MTMINNLSKMGKVRFYVVATLGLLLVSMALFAGMQAHTIKQLKADVKQARIQQKASVDNGVINIPEDGQIHHIKTSIFEIEVVNHDGANFDAVITPKYGRVLGEQGVGAKGLNLYSVSLDNDGVTMID